MSATDNASILWYREIGTTSTYTYEVAVVGPTGAVVDQPVSIFGTSGWESLSDEPTLVSHGSAPLVIFTGTRSFSGTDPYSRGCIFGALSNTPTWVPQSWSLSQDCVNPVGTATETRTGELSAAWPGSWSNGQGVLYRIGTSASIPAKGTDGHIGSAGSGTAFSTGEASDIAGNDDIYVAWTQGFSKPSSADGYYVKDVSTNGTVSKAPGSGTSSVNDLNLYGDLAIANTNTHAGVFVSYCSNGSTCSLMLWPVGAAKALAVPSSSGAYNVAISAGPDGRLWIAWFNQSADTVSTVRTNEADTSFGPVETYKTPFCFEHGLLGVSGGSFGRLDVALQCVNQSFENEEYVTQSLTAPTLSPSTLTIKNTVANNVTFKVTDAGDAVPGATVSVAGKNATTDSSGDATFSFPKGEKTGDYSVTVTAVDYFSAHGTLAVGS